jgi:TonB family protein
LILYKALLSLSAKRQLPTANCQLPTAFRLRRRFIYIIIACALISNTAAPASAQRPRLAVLDFGETETGLGARDKLFSSLSTNKELLIIDRDESCAAARGAGYNGSLNMSLQEARDLGGAIGCDFYITGDAQTLRRSSSARPVYYEAYASVFIVSARTGRLVLWDRPTFEAASPEKAEKSLLDELNVRAAHYADSIRQTQEAERTERAQAIERAAAQLPTIEDAPEDETAAARAGIRLPQPYRRLRPVYPETAARADAEATVDVQVEIDVSGEVANVLVVRWAGFGLDEASVSTVRQLHFRPAMRDGAPVPMRVLLRYNFRRPPR